MSQRAISRVSFPPNSPHFASQFRCYLIQSGRIPGVSSTFPLRAPRPPVNLRRYPEQYAGFDAFFAIWKKVGLRDTLSAGTPT